MRRRPRREEEIKIVVAARCYNNVEHVERFLRGYSFADQIVISDGGSTDGSLELMKKSGGEKVTLLHFSEIEKHGDYLWNPDASHMNFVLDAAKSINPDWLIFDDFDCYPNALLRTDARHVFEKTFQDQVNVFRLYLWGDKEYFPAMNNNFDPAYKSLWAWRPDKINIYADPGVKHGTLRGLTGDNNGLDLPYCLLHRSWHPDTIHIKIDKYNAIGLPMSHPLQFAGVPEKLPLWAHD